MKPRFGTITLWIVIILSFLLVAQLMKDQPRAKVLKLSQLIAMGKAGRQMAPEGNVVVSDANTVVYSVVDNSGFLSGEYNDNGKRSAYRSEYPLGGQDYILNWAEANGITYDYKKPNVFLTEFLPQIVIMVILLGLLWMFLARQFSSGSNKAMSFGKSRAKLVSEGQVKITFEDVAGIDEVKEELQEIIHFLKNPDKYSRLGAKIPKGALLYGPPGTGKTLIARATAGEASVPFFSISGSDFVEMFVGVGASRVRDLFEQGKKAKPCLIYIDEIDAVGRHRFSGYGGGHDEREQTLNALLVELDGFAPNEGVIVMASTNRPDVLDPALLRPGRFDRQIRVDLPDIRGREKILEVHTRTLKMAEGVSLKNLAKATPGFSGADLANLANEAALLAARTGKDAVYNEDMNEAKDRVMMGPARRSLAMTEEERIHTAYHETGHALVAKLLESKDHQVHKVTIIPRGRALGLTAILPEKEMYARGSKQLFDTLVFTMGGRAAEEIVFGDTSTGVGGDLASVTSLARRMVCEFGMGERLGPRTFGSHNNSPMFMGRELSGPERDYSEETASLIDAEIHGLITSAYEKAKDLLLTHREDLTHISQTLLERETLDGEELDALLRGETLPPLNGQRTKEDPETSEQTPAVEPPPLPETEGTLSAEPVPNACCNLAPAGASEVKLETGDGAAKQGNETPQTKQPTDEKPS
jgi:cell division protease FtsH